MYWPVAKKISLKNLKIFLFLVLMPWCSTELNILINFGRRHHEEHFFEIIFNLDQLDQEKRSFKDIFYL